MIDRMITVDVNHCASCPFAHDYDGVLACDAADELERDIGLIGTIDPPCQVAPPDWCPLRVADRLVTLRVQ